MLANRRETIDFDFARHREIETALPAIGTDARLLRDDQGAVLLVTLAEKLLVPALSKLSNFVPGMGIWMNTQRPEWNDANNALVGNGVSMVTLCYLRRYCAFCVSLFSAQGGRRSRFVAASSLGSTVWPPSSNRSRSMQRRIARRGVR